MFHLFGKKRDNTQALCYKCKSVLHTNDTYMLDQQKYCGKCYLEEKANRNATTTFKTNSQNKKNIQADSNNPSRINDATLLAATLINQLSNASLKGAANGKERTAPVSDAELVKYFVEYYSPNTEFFSTPNSEKYNAYFNAINNAKIEMLKHPSLFEAATLRKKEELAEMINNPKPGITNMLICGLIFCMGDYAVIPSRYLCVDFADRIPYCISVFLLLTAQKLPKEKRLHVLDTGDGVDPSPLLDALSSLTACDSAWDCHILSTDLPNSVTSIKDWKKK